MKKFIFASLIVAAPAGAQDTAQLAAFTEGRFVEAAAGAAETGSADELAFAARSTLAEGMVGDVQPSGQLISEAESYARQALELDPDHIEGRLQLAIVYSLKARPLSARQAMKTGYGDKSKALIEGVLNDDPENGYAHGLAAVWNIEVCRRGGSMGAAVMGASIKQARAHYRRATELLPDDASVHWQYARALAAFNAKRYRPDIDAAIGWVEVVGKDDVLETVMAERAATLKTALASLPRDEVEAWAAKAL